MSANSIPTYPLQAAGITGSGQYQEVVSPFTGEAIARVEQAHAGAVEAGLAQAVNAAKKIMGPMPSHRRAEILEGLSAQMDQRREELAQTIAQEGGKPLKDARVEVGRAINTVRLSAHAATELDGEQQAMGGTAGNETK